MRAALSLLLAAVLLSSAIVVTVRTPSRASDRSADAGPDLMPPQPGVQSWPGPRAPAGPIRSPGPTQTTGTTKVLVLLVDFTGVTHDASHTPAFMDGVFNDVSPGTHSLRAYYSEVSYGALTVQATVIAAWFQSVHPMSDYGADGSNPPDDANGPIYRLVTEAVRLADPSVDFSQFDANGDGIVDHLTVVHAGAGQESGGSSDLIWSHRWAVLDADPAVPGSQALTADGVRIDGYTMVSESSPVGVVAHEFGHDLGLPDLYDTDGSSDGAGVWDPMSLGSWNGVPAGSSPAALSAWSRIRLGWVTPTDVTTTLVGTAVPAREAPGEGFPLGGPGTFPAEDFLDEKLQLVGFDAALPGCGLLISHVDESPTSDQV